MRCHGGIVGGAGLEDGGGGAALWRFDGLRVRGNARSDGSNSGPGSEINDSGAEREMHKYIIICVPVTEQKWDILTHVNTGLHWRSHFCWEQKGVVHQRQAAPGPKVALIFLLKY